MVNGSMKKLVRGLRRVVAPQDGGGATDRELLECFLAVRDEAAFAALLGRHGPMVLSVCRRVTGSTADAEDAFQATFLVLMRKAATVRPGKPLGNFLYGVAYRCALKARAMRRRRWRREKQVKEMPHPQVDGTMEEDWPELKAVLDEEIQALPDKYRAPVVLCELEGRGRKDAARELGIPEGTLSSRLAVARRRLAERLSRRGLVIPGVALAALLGRHAVGASVPAAMLRSTIKAATAFANGSAMAGGVVPPRVIAITEGILKMMLLSKLKATVVLIVLATLIGGAVSRVWPVALAHAAPGEPGQRSELPQAKGQPRRAAPEQSLGSRVWVLTDVNLGKNAVSLRRLQGSTQAFHYVAEGGQVRLQYDVPGQAPAGRVSLADLTVAKGAKIFIDGNEATLRDLKAGGRMVVRFTLGRSEVTRLDASSNGTVLKATDVEKNTVTVTMGGQEVTLPLTVNTRFTILGMRAAQFTDLRPGMAVDLDLVVEDGMIAVRGITGRK